MAPDIRIDTPDIEQQDRLARAKAADVVDEHLQFWACTDTADGHRRQEQARKIVAVVVAVYEGSLEGDAA